METVEAKAPKLKSMGSRMSWKRKSLGLSRKQIADIAGVSDACIGQYERDETNPGGPELVRIAEALNCPAKWLLLGRGHETAYPGRDAFQKALEWRDEARTDDEKKAWEEIAATFARAAAVVVLAFSFLAAPPQTDSPHFFEAQPLYIMLNGLLLLSAWLLWRRELAHRLRPLSEFP